MADACIHHDGVILLSPMVGCAISQEDTRDKLYGFWVKVDGKKEMVCWKYENMVLVYPLDNKTLAFLPTEISTDCPATIDDALTAPDAKVPATPKQDSIDG